MPPPDPQHFERHEGKLERALDTLREMNERLIRIEERQAATKLALDERAMKSDVAPLKAIINGAVALILAAVLAALLYGAGLRGGVR